MRNLLLSGGAAILLNLPHAALADQRSLTVVELFQSQGCSDCPPANANVMALSDRPDLLTLSFGVTYWDYLGGKIRSPRPNLRPGNGIMPMPCVTPKFIHHRSSSMAVPTS